MFLPDVVGNDGGTVRTKKVKQKTRATWHYFFFLVQGRECCRAGATLAQSQWHQNERPRAI